MLAIGRVSEGTREDMLVNMLCEGQMAWRQTLTSAGPAAVAVVALGTDGHAGAGVGQEQAGVAGRAGEGTFAAAGFTRGVAPCTDSNSKGFWSRTSGSVITFRRAQRKRSQSLSLAIPSAKSSC